MVFQLYATACFIIGIISGTIADAPITAAGAFVGAGLFGIASALETNHRAVRQHAGAACGSAPSQPSN